MKATILKSAALILLSMVSAVWAEEKDTLNSADVKFVKTEAAASKACVSVAELGASKAKHADIKSFAETLVKDATACNTDLKALASQKGVDISTVLDPDAAGDIQKLEKLGGEEFDKGFLAHVVTGHKKCVGKYEECCKDAKDSDLKAWAVKTLPTLKANLAKAEALTGK